MHLVIDPRGIVRGVYSEAIDLSQLGDMAIRRASHVEPDAAGRWWADLTPVGGPMLGPFGRRSDALTAELTWLEEHWLGNHMENRTLVMSAPSGVPGLPSPPTTPKPEDRPWD
jgi:hypothetical protein